MAEKNFNVDAKSTEEASYVSNLALNIERARSVPLGADLENADVKGILKSFAKQLVRERKELGEEIQRLEEEDGYLPTFDVKVELQIGSKALEYDMPEDFAEISKLGKEADAEVPEVQSGLRVVDDELEYVPGFKRVYVESQFLNADGEPMRYLVNVENLSAGENARYKAFYKGMLLTGKSSETFSTSTVATVVRNTGGGRELVTRVRRSA